MSFLAARTKLPIATVTAAGWFADKISFRLVFMAYFTSAQCLYVLTDDNQPAIDELRSNAAYSTCLLEIVRTDGVTMLKVLASGKNSLFLKYTRLIKVRYPQQRLAFASP